MQRSRVSPTSIVLAILVALAGPPTADAMTTGPYTLPFFGATIRVTQPFGCTGVPEEPPYGSCQHYHAAIDYSTGTGPVVASDNGQVWDVIMNNPDGTCGGSGNRIVIKHDLGGGVFQYTQYYHLKQGSALVARLDYVHGGQRIATSGSSGTCNAHLHYGLHTNFPLYASNGIDPNGHWTTTDNTCCGTWPNYGRVPWLVQYVTEEDPNGWTMLQYSTHTTWVQLRNIGGRTWTQANTYNGKGRVAIYTVGTGGSPVQNSVFAASDWPYVYSPGPADTNNVAYGQSVRFTFPMYASSAGTYRQYFNLGAFQMAGSNALWLFNGYTNWIDITVEHCC